MSILKSSFIVLIIKVAAALLSFAVTATITRKLGVDDSGVYLYAMAMITLAGSFCSLGLNNSVLKYAAIFHSKWSLDELHSVVNKSLLWIVLAGLVIQVGSAVAYWVLNDDAPHNAYFYIFVAAIPFVTLTGLLSHAIQAIGSITVSMLITGIVQPVVLFLLVQVVPEPTINTIAVLYLFAVIAIFFGSLLFWITKVGFKVTIAFDSRILLYSCSSLLVFQVFQQFNTVIGQFLLGIFGSKADLAIFAVSIKLATLTSFIMFSMNRIVAPKFAVLHDQGSKEELRRVFVYSKRIMLAAAVPIVALLCLFPELILAIFGEEFSSGAGILRVLALLQLFSVWGGSLSYLLIMTGKEKYYRNCVVVSTVMSVIVGVLVSFYSPILGAVVASSLSVFITVVLASCVVKEKFGINAFGI